MRSFAAAGVVFGVALSSIVLAQEPKISTIASIGMSKVEGEEQIRFIKLSAVPEGLSLCAVRSGWHYALSLEDPVERQWYEELREALSHHLTVTIYGTGGCSVVPDVESVRAVIIGPPL